MRRATLHIAMLLAGLLAVSRASLAQPFTQVTTNIPAVTFGTLVLGDFDQDGDLDVFAADVLEGQIFFNDGTGNIAVFGAPEHVFGSEDNALYHNGSADAGDFDNDGDLDFLFSGSPEASYVYRNDGSGDLSPADVSLPGLLKSGMIDVVNVAASTWADVDNDGDMDVLLLGYAGDANGAPVSALFLNDGAGGLIGQTGAFPGTLTGPPAWGDFDRDGDVDLLAACFCDASTPTTRIFRNDGRGRFTDLGLSLLAGVPGSTSWGDYDQDGDLDALVVGFVAVDETAGETGSTRTFLRAPYSAIYANDVTGFVRDQQALPEGAFWGDWADLDNDGDLDLIVNAVERQTGGEEVTRLRILANENGRFESTIATLPQVWNGDVAIGDLDNDGDLDLVISGVVGATDGNDPPRTVIYRNDASLPNETPSPPQSMEAWFDGTSVRFAWTPANDAETAPAALTYNLRVGTSPGASDVLSALSRPDGARLLPGPGNVGPLTMFALHGLDPSVTYYWSVQAIDQTLRASTFSPELSTAMATADESVGDRPTQFGIVDGYPNPFNPAATIRYAVDETGPVNLSVYDVNGRRVAVLVEGTVGAGRYEARFDGTGLPSGVYLVRITAGERTDSRAITLLK